MVLILNFWIFQFVEIWLKIQNESDNRRDFRAPNLSEKYVENPYFILLGWIFIRVKIMNDIPFVETIWVVKHLNMFVEETLVTF